MLSLQDRVDFGAIAMKGNFVFSKAPALLEPHYQIVYYQIKDTHCVCVRERGLTSQQRSSEFYRSS